VVGREGLGGECVVVGREWLGGREGFSGECGGGGGMSGWE
jgi:hypothetical protein